VIYWVLTCIYLETAALQASRCDALQQLRAAILTLPRKHDHKAMLGHLWKVIPPLLFSPFPRLATATAGCLAALGAAIFAANGAVITSECGAARTLTEGDTGSAEHVGNEMSGRESGSTHGSRGRGGRPPAASRRRAAHAKAADGARRVPRSAGSPRPGRGGSPRSRADGTTEHVPAGAMLAWAIGVLTGGPCSHTNEVTSGHRELVLSAVCGMVAPDVGTVRTRLAVHVLHAFHRLMDAFATTAEQLPGYLETMHCVVEACNPSDVGRLLPDIVDVFLGWALDAECSQDSRCGWLLPGVVCCGRHHPAVRLCV
jgi:hypothetical protein